jgi:hypothetical protein
VFARCYARFDTCLERVSPQPKAPIGLKHAALIEYLLQSHFRIFTFHSHAYVCSLSYRFFSCSIKTHTKRHIITCLLEIRFWHFCCATNSRRRILILQAFIWQIVIGNWCQKLILIFPCVCIKALLNQQNWVLWGNKFTITQNLEEYTMCT